MEQELHEGPSRAARLRDSFHAWKLGVSVGLLAALGTPLWTSFVTPDHDGLAWIIATLVGYVVEVVGIVAIGRWARRVDHPDVGPWSARLALALVLALLPLALLCGVAWWKAGDRPWAIGAAVLCVWIALHFGATIDRLRRGRT